MAKGVNQPLYTVEILRLAADIPYLAPLKDPHGQAEVRSPTCGSKVSAQEYIIDQSTLTRVMDINRLCPMPRAPFAESFLCQCILV